MIILGIETSCDETAISLIDAHTSRKSASLSAEIRVLAEKTLSQIELHKQYGGVFPNMAKREHSRNLIPLLKTVLTESNLISNLLSRGQVTPNCLISNQIPNSKFQILNSLLEREPELLEQFLEYIPTIEQPSIDAIAVTEGPGLEPCLWTGINLARALSLVWSIPVIPVNHMEGHIYSALLRRTEISNPLSRGQVTPHYLISNESPNPKLQTSNGTPISSLRLFHYKLSAISYPSLSLLISGGHTELVLIKGPHDYEIIGQTRDDAVGEVFDKVARLLGLPYPGGPPLSALAEQARTNADLTQTNAEKITLPRPMIHSGDFDFSFSGIKTAVLYLLKEIESRSQSTPVSDSPRSFSVSPRVQSLIAREFENAVTEVLIAKTRKALEEFSARTLLIGGGVIANTHIRREFEKLAAELNVPLHIPERILTTDNALMIAVAGLARSGKAVGSEAKSLRAKGNLRLN